jgi:hypothetical protein
MFSYSSLRYLSEYTPHPSPNNLISDDEHSYIFMNYLIQKEIL